MGQYYKPIIITTDGRVLSLSSYAFNSGAKLTEHSWISNEFVNAAYSLIYESPKKIAWIGDYAEQEYETCCEAYTNAMPYEEFQKFYNIAWGEDEKGLLPTKLFSRRDLRILDYDTKRMFLINHDKLVYIDMAAFIQKNTAKGGSWDGWCMNPLPLLTACGNGRGGGDYHESCVGYSDIGIWAFDSLEYTGHEPKGYEKIMFCFNENDESAAV
jgi:hypothetical protein